MEHRCHAPNCPTMVPHEIFMCARHWRMVPKPLRDDLARAWRDQSTEAHGGFALEAIRAIASVEGGRTAAGIEPGTKALTLWQPWASLIMIDAKPWEFRKWNFTDRPKLAMHVGRRIVIHASSRQPREGELRDLLHRIEEGESTLRPEIAKDYVNAALGGSVAMPLGAALGTAVLGDPKRSFDLFKNFVADPDRLDRAMYAWPMTDPQPFEAPIPSAGAQGLWNWS